MSGVVCHFWRARARGASCWVQWGPTILTMCAAVLLLVSPLKNLVVNVCMEAFRRHGFSPLIGHVLDIAYMPIFATRLMQIYTVIAYLLMLWATSMQLDLLGKARAVLLSHGGAAASQFSLSSKDGSCPEGG
eukprot:TRINITY_DN63544_c0_g1_i1.p1 TRINITY_DN63544_c0_g1~~TRINITY_DN63544_c0_g1_i1.p1  ORF type:complete len:132 (+),score=20.94 TRINITY_DN63544_c0_g1_i1:363-758(+)